MESGVRVGVLDKVAVAVLIEHAGLLFVLVLVQLEMVVIDKVVAGVVGRVYVPTDFDTKEKALSVAKAAEKGLK